MARAFIGYDIGKLLIEEGVVLPPECRDVDVLIPPDGAVMIRYTTYAMPEDLPKIGRALQRFGEEVIRYRAEDRKKGV